MGCDIHLVAERKTADGWEVIPGPIVPCWLCSMNGRVAAECYRCHGSGEFRASWYSDRLYVVFAALAGVRNYAASPRVDGQAQPLAPIAEPRGLPADMSAETRDLIEDDMDGHSDTWLTLDEVLAYDWDQPITDDTEVWPLRNNARVFLERMEQLRQLTAGDEVRLVFNFDN